MTKGKVMDGTASTGNTEQVSLDAILKAVREIDMLQKPDQWIVIDPHGRMYKGTVEQVLPVLTAAHPMFKKPLSFGSMWPNGDG